MKYSREQYEAAKKLVEEYEDQLSEERFSYENLCEYNAEIEFSHYCDVEYPYGYYDSVDAFVDEFFA